jgi:addiction module RelB/DinJ family antitoxin
MSTKTILNFKVDQKLKASAKNTAQKLGIPLSTVLNAFLRQFVNEKEVTFSLPAYKPSKLLIGIIKNAEKDLDNGNVGGPFNSVDVLIKNLNS